MVAELFDEKHFLEKTKLTNLEFSVFQEKRPEYGTMVIINGEKKLFYTKLDINYANMLQKLIRQNGINASIDYEEYFRIKGIFEAAKTKGISSLDDTVDSLNHIMGDYSEPVVIKLKDDNPKHDVLHNTLRIYMEIKFDGSYPEKSEEDKKLFLQRVRKIVNKVSFAHGKVFSHRPHYFDLTRDDLDRAWRKNLVEEKV